METIEKMKQEIDDQYKEAVAGKRKELSILDKSIKKLDAENGVFLADQRKLEKRNSELGAKVKESEDELKGVRQKVSDIKKEIEIEQGDQAIRGDDLKERESTLIIKEIEVQEAQSVFRKIKADKAEIERIKAKIIDSEMAIEEQVAAGKRVDAALEKKAEVIAKGMRKNQNLLDGAKIVEDATKVLVNNNTLVLNNILLEREALKKKERELAQVKIGQETTAKSLDLKKEEIASDVKRFESSKRIARADSEELEKEKRLLKNKQKKVDELVVRLKKNKKAESDLEEMGL